jgi:hypothetical protein
MHSCYPPASLLCVQLDSGECWMRTVHPLPPSGLLLLKTGHARFWFNKRVQLELQHQKASTASSSSAVPRNR